MNASTRKIFVGIAASTAIIAPLSACSDSTAQTDTPLGSDEEIKVWIEPATPKNRILPTEAGIACGPSEELAIEAAQEILETSGLIPGAYLQTNADSQVRSAIDNTKGYLIDDTTSQRISGEANGSTETFTHEGKTFIGYILGEQPKAVDGVIPLHELQTRFDVQASEDGANLGAVLQTRGPQGNPESTYVFTYRGPTGFNNILVSTSDSDQDIEISTLSSDGNIRNIPPFSGRSESIELVPGTQGTLAVRISDGDQACVATLSNQTAIAKDVPTLA